MLTACRRVSLLAIVNNPIADRNNFVIFHETSTRDFRWPYEAGRKANTKAITTNCAFEYEQRDNRETSTRRKTQTITTIEWFT